MLRPAAHRARPAHRRVGPGVGAHAQPHAPEPVQQRRRRRSHREGSRYGFMGMMRCRDGWVQLVGVMPDAVGRAGGVARRRRARRSERIATAAARAEHMAARGRRAAGVVRAARQGRHRAHPGAARLPGRGVRAAGRISCRRSSSSTAGSSARSTTAAAGRCSCPGRPYRFSATPAAIAIGARARQRPAGSAQHAPSSPACRPGRGLEGVRILDFTWAAAGPYATCLLALLGAEVVKVESTRRPDPARRGFLADYGGINRSPNFNEINLDKRSFQVDLSQPAGLALAHRLARLGRRRRRQLPARRDGPVRPRRRTLLARRPELVVVSSSANGSTGPEAMAAGLASIFGATGGLCEQTGLRRRPADRDRRVDRLPQRRTRWRSRSSPALLHRARTGEGQHVDLASREVVAASSPDALLAEQLGVAWDDPGRQRTPRVRTARRVPRRRRGRLGRDRGRRRRPSGRRCARCSTGEEWVTLHADRGCPPRSRAPTIDDAIARVDPGAVVARGVRGAPGRGRAGDGGDDERDARRPIRTSPRAACSSTSSIPRSAAPA